ncbi:ABC transporter substrate-binding protein [Rhodococcus sp. NPDC057297]|uniref:ABC transporter substrate-binding protein n=1 Tax=Rhodococcus sp. NPDC057297 TaxID=3346090 RepID=UPI003633D490
MKTPLLRASAALALIVLAASCSSTDESTPSASGTHDVVTEFGTVAVPDTIESVVVIDGRRDLDIAIAFDLPVIGMPVETEAPPEIPGPLTEPMKSLRDAGVPELFPRNVIDVESIARVDPDLIIGRNEVIEEIYDQLSAVAPVLPVGSNGTGITWQQDVEAVGEALNMQDRAAEIVDEYDARVEQIKTDHADAIANTEVLPITTSDGSGISIGRERVSAAALIDIGANFSSAWDRATPELDLGPENLSEISDAQALVAAITSEEELRALNSNPLWTGLPAVQSNRVVRTDKFTNDGGPITALWSLDLAEQLYTPTP